MRRNSSNLPILACIVANLDPLKKELPGMRASPGLLVSIAVSHAVIVGANPAKVSEIFFSFFFSMYFHIVVMI